MVCASNAFAFWSSTHTAFACMIRSIGRCTAVDRIRLARLHIFHKNLLWTTHMVIWRMSDGLQKRQSLVRSGNAIFVHVIFITLICCMGIVWLCNMHLLYSAAHEKCKTVARTPMQEQEPHVTRRRCMTITFLKIVTDVVISNHFLSMLKARY